MVAEAKHLAVVGMTEILSHLPAIYREFRKLVRAAESARPALGIVIDSPAFNFRVARELHRRGVPVVYFVAPQLWAWREYRVRRVQRWITKVLCIFPFELDFYRRHGVDAEYVGHPLADEPLPAISREQFARENGLDPLKTWIALLPGSREKEVSQHLLTLVDSAAVLSSGGNYQFLIPLAPSLDKGFLWQALGNAETRSRYPDTMLTDFKITNDARPTLLHSRAAVVTSGTATIEAALMGVPFVAVYRLSPLTFWAARRLVKVPYVAMPNLIAGDQVVPELLQGNFTAENVSNHVRQLLPEGPDRAKMLKGLEKVRSILQNREAGRQPAIERAASAVLAMLKNGQIAPELVQQHLL
jgi:lipid-A-disaccharide synthase